MGGAEAAGAARRLVVEAVHPGVGVAPGDVEACLGNPDRRDSNEVVGSHGREQVPGAGLRPGCPVELDRPVGRAEGAHDCGEGGLVDHVKHAGGDEADPGVVPVPPGQEPHAAAGAPSQRVERVVVEGVAVDDWGEGETCPLGRIRGLLDLIDEGGRTPPARAVRLVPR